jgi:hypothetical protein
MLAYDATFMSAVIGVPTAAGAEMLAAGDEVTEAVVTVMMFAAFAATIVKPLKATATTAISEIRFRSVFVDIIFLSIVGVGTIPTPAWLKMPVS